MKKIQADIVVLDMSLLDMTKYKDSLGLFVDDLFFISPMDDRKRKNLNSEK